MSEEIEMSNMTAGEFQAFLEEALINHTDDTESPSTRILSFDRAGVFSRNHGLVVAIGKAEFHISIVRSR